MYTHASVLHGFDKNSWFAGLQFLGINDFSLFQYMKIEGRAKLVGPRQNKTAKQESQDRAVKYQGISNISS